MISFFRRALSSWFILALLALVLVAFIVTGVQDPFGGGGGGKAGVLARVGGLEVTEGDFDRVWRRQLEQARERSPDVTPEQLARAGAVEVIVQDLVSARALEAFGREQGVRAGLSLVDAEIRGVPAFQTAGRFDQTVYEQALAGQRLTDRELRDGLSGDIVRRQLVQPVLAPALAAAGLAAPYAQLLLERKEGLIGVIPAATVTGAPAPSEAQLRALYGARRGQLTIPERRSFRFAAIDPAIIAAGLSVSDAEVGKFYAANPARFGGTEKRRVQQAAAADEASARRLIAAAGGGGVFDAAAQSVAGLARSDTELGSLTRAELVQAGGEAAAAAVFALPEGGLSGPVRTPFGWRVYKVEAVERTAGRTLDVAREEIAAELKRTRAEARAAEIGDAAQKALSDGANFAEVAQRFGLIAISVPPVTRSGEGAPGLAGDARLKPLIDAAFGAEPGEEPTVEDLGEGRAALFAFGDVTPPTVPPFETVRGALAELWVREWKQRRTADLAKAVAVEVRGGKPLAAALRERGAQPPQPVGARRIDIANAPAGSVPAPVALFLETSAGQVRTLAAAGGQGTFVLQVLRASAAPAQQVAALTGSAQKQFGDLYTDELTRQLALAARAAVKTEINQAAVARLRARLAGEAEPGAR